MTIPAVETLFHWFLFLAGLILGSGLTLALVILRGAGTDVEVQ